MKKKYAILLLCSFFFFSLANNANELHLPPPPPPSNDDCAGAISLAVGASCSSYTTYDNTSATASVGAPAPGCANYISADVWFKITVPASGHIALDFQTGAITDGGLALYSGTCGSLTLIECNDDGSANGLMPMIDNGNLTPGSIVFIRFWEYGGDVSGTFGVCAFEPAPSCTDGIQNQGETGVDCGGPCAACPPPPPACGANPAANNAAATATPICNLNGFCGNTSTSYTADSPGNLASVFCGGIDNNSWLSFVADATSATLNIYVSNCTNGDGIQMEIYSTPDFTTFTSHSNCWNPGIMQNGTISATSLTVGQTYYLMIDGWAGDDCDFVIAASSGVLTPDAGPDASICQGGSTSLSASGGTAYHWAPATGLSNVNIANPTASPTATTTYTVSVTGGNPSCPATVTDAMVLSVTKITASAGIDTSICSGLSTTLTATGGDTYSWSPGGATTAAITVSPAATTTYTVTVTNTGCTGSDAAVVTINSAPTANAGADKTICSNGSTTLTASGGGTYLWSNAETTASITVSPLLTTTYTVTVTNSGCTASDNAVVTVNALPTANAGIDQSICDLTSATLNATGGGTYLWSNGNTSSSISVSPLATTTYTVTVTNGGCSASDNVTVTINANPIANAGSDNTICINTSTTLTASGGGTYLWSNGGNSATITVNPASTTTYTVTVTNNGCTNTDYAIITVIPLPIVTAGTDQTVCNGNPATLTASGGGSYIWNTGATTASISVNPIINTTYTVTVTNSGCTASDDVAVIANSLPPANAGADQTICNGDAITLTATGGVTYLWNTTETTSSISVNPNSTTIYTVTATSNGCTATDDVVITVNTIPTANAGPDVTICEGTSTTLTANGGGTYSWNTGSTSASISVSPIVQTLYTVTVTVGGCTDSDDVLVKVSSVPNASISSSLAQICQGQSTILTASGGTNYLWSTGEITSVITVTPAASTTYTVTVSISGCTDTENITINVDPAITATSSPTTICAGDPCVLTCSGGSTYLWSTGEAVQTITVTPTITTTYSVTASNNTCTATTIATVFVTPLPLIDAGNDQTICPGATATLTASGGGSYLWNTGASTSSFVVSPLVATTYTLTITASGCSATDQTVVNVSATLVADVGPDIAICNGSSINITATGGAAYLWNNGATTSTINVNPIITSTYSVTVGSAGCSATDEIIVTVNNVPVVNAGADQTICAGSTSTIGATGGGTYLWSSGGETTSSISVSPAITTTYSLTVTANGCSDTDEVIINVNPLPIVLLNNDTTICSGTNITLTASGGSSYLWSSGSTGDSVSVSPNTTSTYSVTVTDAGCSVSDNVIITVNSPPVVNAGFPMTICSGSSATFTAFGGTNYVWSSGENTASITVNPPISTTYSVIVLGANGCSASDDVALTVDLTPIANAGLDQSICNGFSTTLSGMGGTNYSWSTGELTQSISANPVISTTYTLTVTTNSCMATDEVIINVSNSLIANAGADQFICTGTSANLSGSGGASYLWSSGDTSSSITIFPIATSTYTLTVSSGLCSATDDIIVSIITPPTPDAGANQFICIGQSANLLASGGTSYIWSTTDNTASITVSPLLTTTYTVTATLNGCNAIDSVSVTVYPIPLINAGPDQTTCTGVTATLTSTGTGSYLWDNGDTTASTIVTPMANTTYTVTITNLGCTASDQVVVTVMPFLIANAGPDLSSCVNDTITLSASGGSTYVWNTGANTPSITVSPLTMTTYTVTASSGVCTATDDVVITVNPPPIAEAGPNQTACADSPIILNASGGTSYIWSNNDTTASITTNPVVSTTYYVTITNNGCTASDKVIITITPLPVANAGQDTSTCIGDAIVLSSAAAQAYLWNNGDTTNSITVSPSITTTYTLTITSFGCSASDNVVLTVNPLPTANAGADQTICPYQTATLTATGGLSYSWSNGMTDSVINVNPVITTTYIVTVTGNSCTATDFVVVNVTPLSNINAGNDQVMCFGSSTTLTGSGGGTYLWSTGDTLSTITINPSVNTTYSLTVTNNGCSASDDIVVSLNSQLVANAGTDQTLCNGQSTNLTASGGAVYNWDNGATGANISVSPVISTTYTVTVSSGICSATDDIIVTVNQVPIADGGLPQTICENDQIILTATGGQTYQWSSGDSAATIILHPLITTTYSVTVSNSECSDVDNVIITVNPIPSAIAWTDQTICFGENTSLVAIGSGTFHWSGGQNNDTIIVSPLTTTTYSVTVTNNGCTASDNVIITVNPLPTANAGPNQTICTGNSTAITATGGTSYEWNTGAFIAEIPVNPTITTTYIVTATQGGCTDSDDIVVFVNQSPTVSILSSYPNVCQGQSIQLTGTGGSSYSWSTGAMGSIINVTPITTTTYIVTATASNGCSATASTSINVNTNIAVNASPSTICRGDSSILTVSSGGTTYLWSTGDSVQSIVVWPINTTTYSVTVTNATCSADVNVVVTVNSTPLVSAGADQNMCSGSQATMIGSGNGTFHWNTGESTASIVVAPTITTTYTITVTNNGCTASDTAILYVNPKPTATISGTTSICSGSGATLSITSTGTSPFNLTYTDGSTPITVFNVGSPYIFTVNPSATAVYTITSVSDANSCSNTAAGAAVITLFPKPTASISGTDNICAAGYNATISVNFTGISPWNFTYSDGSTTVTVNNVSTSPYPFNVSPIANSVYTITNVTDGHNCSNIGIGSASVIITSPIANIPTAANVKCFGGHDGVATATAIGGTTPYTYHWSNNPSQNNSTTYNLTSGIQYTVTITDIHGCIDTASITLSSPSQLNISAFSSDVKCYNGNDGLGNSVTSGGTTPYFYFWNSAPAQLQDSALFLYAGNYMVIVTDRNFCKDTAYIIVNQPPAINIILNNDSTLCPGSMLQINANVTGGTPSYFYHWNNGIANTNNQTVIVDSANTYTLYVTDANNCVSSTKSFSVNLNPPLSVTMSSASPVNICSGGSFSINSFVSGSNGSPVVYAWNNGIGTRTPPFSVSPSANTTYIVTISDNCSLPIVDSLAVIVNPLPNVQFAADTINGCSPVVVHFQNNSGSNITHSTWNFGDQLTSTQTNPTHTFAVPGTFDITLSVTSASGCSNYFTIPEMIEVYPSPHPDFFTDPSSGTIIESSIQFYDNSAGASVWHWDYGDSTLIDTVSIKNPIHDYQNSGSYTVWLTVENEFNCIDSISKDIIIDNDFAFYIPTAFTPNHNDLNDNFSPKGVGVSSEGYQFYIYNRWGELIWETKEWNKPWDGKYVGTSIVVQPDVYTYIIYVTTFRGEVHRYIGNLTIIK